MAHALHLRGLRKAYGKTRALDGLDLAVPAGSLFGLVGANGAGKTTLMSIGVGLLQADGGEIDVLGAGPFHPVRHAGRVALLPQDSRLPLHARVGELLHFYGRLQGVPAADLPAQVDRLLHWVNLADRARAQVRTLSHGMMRRLTIAQAFLGNPELIFLDEPMSGLDPREVARIRQLLLQRRGGQTVVISSHILSELEALCDTVAFVDKGKLLRQDTLHAMMRRHRRITYRVRPAPLPLDRLRAALPDAEWAVENGGTELVALTTDGTDAAALNAAVLSILLESGVGIEEVRRGSDLETEYLAATNPAG